ncbi:MAG: helix-turn-helix domain-containing protein [Lachnospiraceae bacterium]|nr:helix-turn-helix domain-containing protein [Lachnospiraceae bacterium]
MIGKRLKKLRKEKNFSLEYVAEKIDVSRQTVAKWEAGETLPDVVKCKKLMDLYESSLDELTMSEKELKIGKGELAGQTGKYIFGIVRAGEGGQIIIPQKARKVLHIQKGDRLLVLGNPEQGMTIVKIDELNDYLN